ncbi:DUF4376 domain-containing protein [Pseudomonas sp.]|uniref:DUF4376 domain-containing protein n=1 Tax=Pseudomonas sp. TaxID=306 RepID=UPI0025910A84|nr:DUF4376 domain-containing protein [Pseudomonas sp.]
MITLHLWDERSLYAGSVEVDEADPMPGRSTPTKPPKLAGDEVAQWVGNGWQVLDSTPDEPEPEEPVIDWHGLIAERRWRAETGGFVWNGCGIDTGRDSQAKINASWAAASAGIRDDSSVWKCLDVATGQVVARPTTNAEMIDIGQAAYRYVQACYDREGVLLAAVADGSISSEMLEQGWPA